MNIIRINSRNVSYLILGLLLSTVKAQMGARCIRSTMNTTSPSSIKKQESLAHCPAGKQCSELLADCLKCTFNMLCVYGATEIANCSVKDGIDCVGDRENLSRKYVCRYCYQTEHWEHQCYDKNTCSSVSSPQQHYQTNCTVNNDILCLGRRRFMKNLPCNYTGGYRWSTALILSITLGGFGADRFYLGQWQEGIGKLFSFGGLGVWTLIDVMLISMRYLGPADGSLYI